VEREGRFLISVLRSERGWWMGSGRMRMEREGTGEKVYWMSVRAAPDLLLEKSAKIRVSSWKAFTPEIRKVSLSNNLNMP